MGTHCQCFVHDFPQTFLVGRRGNCAALVNGGSGGVVALAQIIVVKGQAVHAAILLIVVSEGDDDVVASLHVLLGGLPQLVVAAPGVASTLGIIDAGPSIGEESAEIHAPSAGHGGILVIVGHGGVAQCMDFLGIGGNRWCQHGNDKAYE